MLITGLPVTCTPRKTSLHPHITLNHSKVTHIRFDTGIPGKAEQHNYSYLPFYELERLDN